MLAPFSEQSPGGFRRKQEGYYAVVPNGSMGCLDVVAGP
jgi:hypothetical protein